VTAAGRTLLTYVSRDLTALTGCTMRALRNARLVWAVREGHIDELRFAPGRAPRCDCAPRPPGAPGSWRCPSRTTGGLSAIRDCGGQSGLSRRVTRIRRPRTHRSLHPRRTSTRGGR
jgi:hypothetical protein